MPRRIRWVNFGERTWVNSGERQGRIELMLALPLQTLDKMALQHEVKAIGAR